jgi:hypothetical protein
MVGWRYFIMKNFTMFTVHLMLLGWLNWGWWADRGKQHVWRSVRMFSKFDSGNLRGRYRLGSRGIVFT